MQQFLGFAIPGVPYGCTYAIVAVGLVLTYQATGVFNFAFGAQAYTSAFVYTKLVQNDNLPIWLAFLISVVVLAPLLGSGLRPLPVPEDTQHQHHGQAGHRHQPSSSGSRSCCPCSSAPRTSTTRPASSSTRTSSTSTSRDADQRHRPERRCVITAVVLIALVILMRFTNLGLQMRARSRAGGWSQLDGVNAGRWWPRPGPSPASWPGWPGSCSPRSTTSCQFGRLRHPAGGGLRRRRLGRRSAPCPSPPWSGS